jgi:glycyl-tRNA synthetase
MNIEELVAFAKQRGFFWPSAEIYGGASGIYDYGNTGYLLKKRFESAWVSFFVDTNPDYHVIEGSTILPEAPLVSSGHASMFNDIIVGCSKCNAFYRADVLLSDYKIKVSEGATPGEIDSLIRENKIKCPKCKSTSFSGAKMFNMMLEVRLGPEKAEKGYLRPETAQSSFLNFFREYNILRKSLPLGLAIIGRAYRNEISPRQGLYRLRELTQAELQIFFDPAVYRKGTAHLRDRKLNVWLYNAGAQASITVGELVEKHSVPEFYAYHMCMIDSFYKEVMGIPPERIRFFEKGGNEKAFYNKLHMDIEVEVESWGGFREVGGLHYRGDYDLTQHGKGSKQDMGVLSSGQKVIPNVLELSFGVDRNVWMLIDVLMRKDGERSVLSLPYYLAPYNLAIFGLQKDKEIDDMVQSLYKRLRPKFKVFLDSSGSIGRRYARMDELGTPFCVTVDYESVKKDSGKLNTFTVRIRDDKSQVRLGAEEIEPFLAKELSMDPYKLFSFDQ